MDREDARLLMEKGIDCLEKSWASDAVDCFQEVLDHHGRSAAVLSWLGLAMARTKKGDLRPALQFCREAKEMEYFNPSLYRNLAEVYLICGKKKKAIRTIREGLRVDPESELLLREMSRLGHRQRPPIPFLERSNPLNIMIGKIRHKLHTLHAESGIPLPH